MRDEDESGGVIVEDRAAMVLFLHGFLAISMW